MQPEILSPSKLNPNTPAFTPTNPSNSVMVPYIKFMARRELKFDKFNDHPEISTHKRVLSTPWSKK